MAIERDFRALYIISTRLVTRGIYKSFPTRYLLNPECQRKHRRATRKYVTSRHEAIVVLGYNAIKSRCREADRGVDVDVVSVRDDRDRE